MCLYEVLILWWREREPSSGAIPVKAHCAGVAPRPLRYGALVLLSISSAKKLSSRTDSIMLAASPKGHPARTSNLEPRERARARLKTTSHKLPEKPSGGLTNTTSPTRGRHHSATWRSRTFESPRLPLLPFQ